MAETRKILEFDTAGDPVTGRIWNRITPEKIARCLEECIGLRVSATTVHRLLRQLQYSLKGNKKNLSCGFHPDRDQQFLIIQQLREQFMAAGDPIISVDTKKEGVDRAFQELRTNLVPQSQVCQGS
jgi:hypothetical protein